MTHDRKTRRRFLADFLFAGGAVTAASMLGYVATAGPPPEASAATPTPVTPCTPPPNVQIEVIPEGKMAPVRDIQPGGKPMVNPR